MLLRLVRWLPPDLIRSVGAWQFRCPLLGRVIRRCARVMTQRTDVIARGIGAGLKFNATGGYPGYLLGTSEPEEQQALATHLRPGGVFYDIGANIGFYAVIGARLAQSHGHVYAFEPFPESAERIRGNAALNGLENVRVFTVAVGNTDGMTRLEVGEKSASHRITIASGAAAERPVIETPVVTLDACIAREGLRPPTVVMIDVEGAEIGVLRGMLETLARCRPVVMCEVHWINRHFTAFYEESLRPLGYTMTALDGVSPLPKEPARYHVLLKPGTP